MANLKINDFDLYYELHGDRSHPPLLLIGGLSDNTRNWKAIAHHLSKDFFVILPDLRGSGQSQNITEDFTIKDMALDLKNLLKELSVFSIHILGFSMGGRIAIKLNSFDPNLIKSLTLVSTSYSWNTPYPAQDSVRETMNSFDGSERALERRFEILFGKKYKEKFNTSNFIKFFKLNPHPQTVKNFKRQLKATQDFEGKELVSHITSPTLILTGDVDQIIPMENAIDLHHKIPNSQLEIFKDCGHVLPAEYPQKFIRTVSNFIKENCNNA